MIQDKVGFIDNILVVTDDGHGTNFVIILYGYL